MITKNISPASACYPGKPVIMAMRLISENNPKDHPISTWDFSHAQLCPQHIGSLSKFSLDNLLEKFPNTQFRLHANVRVASEHRPFDAGFSLKENLEYVKLLKEAQQHIQAQHYSYHAPMRNKLSWDAITDNVLELQDFLGIPVSLEGLYPNNKLQDDFWKDSLCSYEMILKKNILFALDLSHLHIAYAQGNELFQINIKELTQEMLSHRNCKEIHISHNDGKHDSHKPINSEVWWIDLLNASKPPSDCVIFCESMQ